MKSFRNQRISRRPLSDLLYEQVLERILSGELAPGASVSEAEVGAMFEVSRTPIREVLIKLGEQGLVDVFPQVGTFIAPIRIDEVTQAAFIRENLECALVREAAGKIDQAGIDALAAILREQEAAQQAGDMARFYQADEAMHARIAEIAGKPRVWRVIQQSKIHVDRVRRLALKQKLKASLVLEQHRRICDALAARDADGAAACMREHLHGVYEFVRKVAVNEMPASGGMKSGTKTGTA
ncbi:GntR family transcriptional regulator [Achromobacter aloeverae]